MDKHSDIWLAISAVLSKTYSKEEQQQVEDWIAKDEKNKSFFDKLSSPGYTIAMEERAVEAKERIYLMTRGKVSRATLQVKLRMWKYIAAASIVIACIISGGSLIKLSETSAPILVETTSPVNARTKLTLDDGSAVELNAGSTLSYPLRFTGNSRTVALHGEAYFEVIKNEKSPFVVEMNGLKLTVLGTSFNAKSYADDDRIITTLLEGSVSIEPDNFALTKGKPVILKPNQQLVYTKNTNSMEVKEVKAELYASWKDGQCFFDNERFVDIAKILGRHFGVPITVTSPALENQLYSGFFTQKEGVLQILNAFRKYRNFDYRQTDTGIEIYEK